MRKVTAVRAVGGYCLELTFDTGEAGRVDLSGLVGKGVFEMWSDPDSFGAVTVGTAGQVCWGGAIELCPDALYLEAMGLEPDQLFPNLRHESVHAGS